MGLTGILHLLFLSLSTGAAPLPHSQYDRNKKNGIHLWRRLKVGGVVGGGFWGLLELRPLGFLRHLTNGTKCTSFLFLMGQKSFWQGMNMGILSDGPPSGFTLSGTSQSHKPRELDLTAQVFDFLPDSLSLAHSASLLHCSRAEGFT